MIEAAWSVKPKILTLCPLQKKFADACSKETQKIPIMNTKCNQLEKPGFAFVIDTRASTLPTVMSCSGFDNRALEKCAGCAFCHQITQISSRMEFSGNLSVCSWQPLAGSWQHTLCSLFCSSSVPSSSIAVIMVAVGRNWSVFFQPK